MTANILQLPPKSLDRTGYKWGRWTVISYAGRNAKKHLLWLCRCECGTEKKLTSNAISGQDAMSCGCIKVEVLAIRNTKHGLSKTPEYGIWSAIRVRCSNPYNPETRKNYADRGIAVCARWTGEDGFAHFIADMGKRPSGKYSIERRDNDAGYNPENCYWATRIEQARNKRNNRLLTFNGETITAPEWADRLGIKLCTLHMRLHRGWSVEDTLSLPAKGHEGTAIRTPDAIRKSKKRLLAPTPLPPRKP